MEQLDEIEQTLQTTSQFQRLFILLGAENIDGFSPTYVYGMKLNS